MKTLPLKSRQRILDAYDRGKESREQIAERFSVSLGMVKKLLQMRRESGDIAPRHHLSGRKPKLLDSHREKTKALVAKNPSITLSQLRDALKIDCTLPAIHYMLADLGLTGRKRSAAPAKAKKTAKPAAVKKTAKPQGQAKKKGKGSR